MDISELVQCEGQLASMSAVKLVVGWGGGSFFAMAFSYTELHHGTHYTCTDPKLLHSYSRCGVGSLFHYTGDSIYSPSSSVDGLHYVAACQQQHLIQT